MYIYRERERERQKEKQHVREFSKESIHWIYIYIYIYIYKAFARSCEHLGMWIVYYCAWVYAEIHAWICLHVMY